MMNKPSGAAGVLLAILLAAPVSAREFLPALVYGGNKYDKGFNEMAFVGAERFKKDFAARYLEVQTTNDTQKEQSLRAMARRADMVIAVGVSFTPAVEIVAREFPRTRFVMIDAAARGANVASVLFREQEGAFLVGMAAAMKSRSGSVGFIGGMGLPLIRSFACGYVQGARFVDGKIRVIQNMAWDTQIGFSDPARGAELARSQFDRGADVIFSAANLTTLGVLQQARDSGKLAIGVDSNQNGLYPGTVLTSMVKRVDNAVYAAMKSGKEKGWKAGATSFGLKEGGVDWALDAHNRALITPEMEARINAARDGIVAGRLKVVDYRSRNACPVS
ncbi:BMP family lipoprotein [Paludibacterium yongneupense]|uniref:BMP family lipoprotein n=1 Tax=Paludibacterium yongneupense TaxID=400061 RepID=UPI0004164CFA|nr:BMP family ABC transporter substrate-binding protein [Paludibacterium yongneupense]